MKITPEQYILVGTLLGSLIGSIIGSVTTIVTFWLSKHYENKKNFQSLVVQAGLQNWEGARKAWEKNGGALKPLESFIIHQAKIIELITRNDISEDKVKEALQQSRKISKILEKNKV